MNGEQTIIYCSECTHCFKSRRSPSGYACEVWGYEDFACPTIPNGFCHKAKAKTYPIRQFTVSVNDIQKLKGE